MNINNYEKKLLNYNLNDLKKLCNINKISCSNLNKNQIIHLLKKNNYINPNINIYIYNILNHINSTNNYKYHDGYTMQQFNNFNIESNELGIIHPFSYILKNRQEKNPRTELFNINKIESNQEYVYNFDLITNKMQQGGNIKEISKFYNFYKNKLTRKKNFENSGSKFYTNDSMNDILNTITKAISQKNRYIKINSNGNNENNHIVNTNNSNISNNSSNSSNSSYNSSYNSNRSNNSNRSSNNSRSSNNRTINNKLNGAYIFNIDVSKNEKIILFGDIHSSYHTFFRIFIRLHILGVIDFPNYKINDNYRLIFLGDIVDRGQYSIEILYILSKFIINNKHNKIIINRGNHEESIMWKDGGFENEISTKFPNNKKKLIGLFKNFFAICSSAIILNYNKKKYWLSHGGFPIGIEETDPTFIIPENKVTFYNSNINISEENNNSEEINNNSFQDLYKEKPYQIRWCDFSNKNKSTYTDKNNNNRNEYIDRPKIGLNKLNSFLKENNIDFIIRGHTDNDFNAFLLNKVISTNKNKGKNKNIENCYLPLNHINLYENNENNENNKNINIIDNKSIIFPTTESIQNKNNVLQTSEILCKIKTNDWNNNNINLFNINNEASKLYPVLTISTNSDYQRKLNDGFICFNFSNEPDFPKKNIERGKVLMSKLNKLKTLVEIQANINYYQNDKNISTIKNNPKNIVNSIKLNNTQIGKKTISNLNNFLIKNPNKILKIYKERINLLKNKKNK